MPAAATAVLVMFMFLSSIDRDRPVRAGIACLQARGSDSVPRPRHTQPICRKFVEGVVNAVGFVAANSAASKPAQWRIVAPDQRIVIRHARSRATRAGTVS